MKLPIRSFPVLVSLVMTLALAGAAFAFQMAAFKPGRPGDVRVENPLLTPVFEGGGQSDASGVDVNSPPIGDCSAADKNGKYKVSTCLGSPVQEQLYRMARNYVEALKMMAAQMTGVMGQQALIVGSYFDADEQLDTQRDLQMLSARAQKDYHPSEQLCAYGTGIRSLADTEERGRMNNQALNAILMKEYSNNENTVAAAGLVNDRLDRLQKFKDLYCDPRDHGNQLWELCFSKAYEGGPPSDVTLTPERLQRVNKDIDYHRTLSEPRTLDVDFTDTVKVADEEDVIALARNLYWDRAMDPAIMSAGKFDEQGYMTLRSLIAKGSLAHNSFTTIVGMKSKSPVKTDPAEEIRTGGAHLKAILKDFNIPPADIEKMFGHNPSYFAQMEILSKTLYQHPNFYTNLYDKPANIARINAAMTAIRLMQLRDRFDSQTRRELLMAALMEDSLGTEENKVYSAIQALVSARQ